MQAVERIGVVGAGLMGSEIGLVFALAGYQVLLADQTEALLAAARDRLKKISAKGAMRGFYTTDAAAGAMARIATTTDLSLFRDREFVTEAVFEDLAVKREVLTKLDEVCPRDCVIATNTSTIPISTLAACLSESRRGNFLGTHYFSPASRMKLVEVIPAFQTSPHCKDLTLKICAAIGKTPICVKDVAGFAVNRVLHALLIEAVRLVEEGVATPEDIDTACRLGLGHPIGPFELMDATTSRLCLQAQEIMQEAYGERFRPRPLLKQRVRAGLVGGKTGKGWLKPSDTNGT
jgi:3-hydroxybutyryl-CoA dehydrogenase